ncbi:hypothetical protein HPB48_011653 [Haemaphysalis longicornis]|uniref:Peptidase aspartic putative domain-containing protein n=1 Tax=Haemaphysalis longicornis TaxID=44386 RepID=A0A9J6GWB0_HAELO|nr:hypothetical protein HPB48_011653 [Haemaphysalis longicornis]
MKVVQVKIKRHPSVEEIIIDALEIDTISKDTLSSPSKRVVQEVKGLGLTLADDLMQYHKTRAPLTTSLLVGAEYYWAIVTGRRKWLQDKVMAAETILGWTLHGPTQPRAQPMNSLPVMVLEVTTRNEDINEEVTRFLELESIGMSDNTAHTKTNDNDGVHTYMKDTKEKKRAYGFPGRALRSPASLEETRRVEREEVSRRKETFTSNQKTT